MEAQQACAIFLHIRMKAMQQNEWTKENCASQVATLHRSLHQRSIEGIVDWVQLVVTLFRRDNASTSNANYSSDTSAISASVNSFIRRFHSITSSTASSTMSKSESPREDPRVSEAFKCLWALFIMCDNFLCCSMSRSSFLALKTSNKNWISYSSCNTPSLFLAWCPSTNSI